MATRSFSVTMIRWVDNTAGNTYGPVRVLPDGKDLLDLLEGVLESLDASPARDKSRETLTKQVGRAKSRRTILGQMRHGGYGEDGEVVDTRTGQITYTYRPDQATTLVHRLLITVPPSGDAAMLFIEHASRRNPGKAFLDRLDDHWKARFPSHDLVTETMQESDAWLEQATLVSATAIYSDSLAANQVPHGIPARISKTITPKPVMLSGSGTDCSTAPSKIGRSTSVFRRRTPTRSRSSLRWAVARR
ncbi:hypothetical protein ACX31A_12060 [Dermacoccus nishinomiyaensis]